MNVHTRYHFLTVELARDHYELAHARKQRTLARIESYTSESAKTASERDQRADVASVGWHIDVLELEGSIAAKVVEIEWLQQLLADGITEYSREVGGDPESSPLAPNRIARAAARARRGSRAEVI